MDLAMSYVTYGEMAFTAPTMCQLLSRVKLLLWMLSPFLDLPLTGSGGYHLSLEPLEPALP